MNYSIGDLLRCKISNEYLLVTGIIGDRIDLQWLTRGLQVTYLYTDVSYYYISL